MKKIIPRFNLSFVSLLTIFYIILLILFEANGFFSTELPESFPREVINKNTSITAQVLKYPEQKNNKLYADVLLTQSDSFNLNNIAILRFSNIGTNIAPGDIIKCQAVIKLPPAAQNPGGFDYKKYLVRKNIFLTIDSKDISVVSKISLPFYKRVALKLQNSISSSFFKYLPKEKADVLSKMIIGYPQTLTQETRLKFTNAGVMHILVVSGLNVGYCAAIFWFLFRLLGTPFTLSGLLTIPFIILYTLATGAQPPVVRAAIMASFLIISISLKRETALYHSLFLAALLILLITPQDLFTASFQLSFFATFGILYLFPAMRKLYNKVHSFIPRLMLDTFTVSLCAQIAVMPILAYYFNKIPLAGLASNIIIVPFSGLLMISGLFLYCASLLPHFLGFILTLSTAVNIFLLDVLLKIVEFFASLSFSNIYVSQPSIKTVFACYLIIFIAPLFKKIPKTVITTISFSILLITVSPFAASKHYNNLKITFLDSPNAPCAHIQFPNGTNWLIDAGSNRFSTFESGTRLIIPYLLNNNIKVLDKMIITNPVYKRYGGLKTMLGPIEIKEVLSAPIVSYESEFTELLSSIKNHKVPFKECWVGDTFYVADSTISVLSPELVSLKTFENCLILLIEYEGKTILLTSDYSGKNNSLTKLINKKKINVLQIPSQKYINRDSLDWINSVDYEYLVTQTKGMNLLAETLSDKNNILDYSDGALTITIGNNEINISSFND